MSTSMHTMPTTNPFAKIRSTMPFGLPPGPLPQVPLPSVAPAPVTEAPAPAPLVEDEAGDLALTIPSPTEKPEPAPRRRPSPPRLKRFVVGITLKKVELPPPVGEVLGDSTALFALFEEANGRFKRQGMLLQAPSRTLELTWEDSRPPELRVVKGEPTGLHGQAELQLLIGCEGECIVIKSKERLGIITRDGLLMQEEGVSLSSEVTGFLRRLLAEPTNVLAECGREAGLCIFCGRRLTDARSAKLGYGKGCAKTFSMEWSKAKEDELTGAAIGDDSANREFSQDHAAQIEAAKAKAAPKRSKRIGKSAETDTAEEGQEQFNNAPLPVALPA